MVNAIILNDTRPGGHVGCNLVMQQLLAECKFSNINILCTFITTTDLASRIAGYLPWCNIAIINGEGTMHHDGPGALILTQAAKIIKEAGIPIALINTVWEGNIIANQLLPILSLIYTRESLSARAIKSKHQLEVNLAPDLIFNHAQNLLFHKKSNRRTSIITTDNVRPDLSTILARYALRNKSNYIRMQGRPSLRSLKSISNWAILFAIGRCKMQIRIEDINIFADADIVVTGRFHGACLSILAGKPFIAVESNTHKIQGLLRDANLGGGAILIPDELLGKDPIRAIENATASLQTLVKDKLFLSDYKNRCNDYITNGKFQTKKMFAEIFNLARNYAP